MTCMVWKTKYILQHSILLQLQQMNRNGKDGLLKEMKCNSILHSPVQNTKFRSVSKNGKGIIFLFRVNFRTGYSTFLPRILPFFGGGGGIANNAFHEGDFLTRSVHETIINVNNTWCQMQREDPQMARGVPPTNPVWQYSQIPIPACEELSISVAGAAWESGCNSPFVVLY